MPANPEIDLGDYAEEMPRFYHAVEVVKEADCRIEVPDNLWPCFHSGNFIINKSNRKCSVNNNNNAVLFHLVACLKNRMGVFFPVRKKVK